MLKFFAATESRWIVEPAGSVTAPVINPVDG